MRGLKGKRTESQVGGGATDLMIEFHLHLNIEEFFRDIGVYSNEESRFSYFMFKETTVRV